MSRAVDPSFHPCVPSAAECRTGQHGKEEMNNAKLVWIGMLACATALPAAGADARELRVAESFPVGHYLVRLLLKPWMRTLPSAPMVQ